MEITINKKSYPVSFGTAAIRDFCKQKKINLQSFTKLFSKIDKKNVSFDTLDDISLLVLCGVKDALRKQKRRADFDLEIEDFYDFIDEGGDLEAVFSELTEAMPAAEEKGEPEGNPNPAKAKS